MEVVQRLGYDSFCPDNGVLLSKNKDKEGRNGGPNEFNCFNWVIDAHPEDINMVDYVKPNGTKVMRTVADYRQLNDALFHAGLNSGSEFEFIDKENGLHFYIIDLQRDNRGILSYIVGVRSTEEKSGRKRNFELAAPAVPKMKGNAGKVILALTNNDPALAVDASAHKVKDADLYLKNDIYRISATVSGEGWDAVLLNELWTVLPGQSVQVPVHVRFSDTAAKTATLTINAVSESDNSVKKQVVISLKK